MFVEYCLLKIMGMQKQIFQLANSFPNPEELAKEVLKVKLPVTDLPQEMQDAIKEQIKKDKKDRSYVG